MYYSIFEAMKIIVLAEEEEKGFQTKSIGGRIRGLL
jgi:hypothetical protein